MLSESHVFSHLIFQPLCKQSVIVIPIFQKRKLKLREVWWLALGQKVSQRKGREAYQIKEQTFESKAAWLLGTGLQPVHNIHPTMTSTHVHWKFMVSTHCARCLMRVISFNAPRKHNRVERLDCGAGSSQRRMWEKWSWVSGTGGLLGPLEEAATQDQRLRGLGVNSVGWGGTPEWAGNHFQVMLGANGSEAEPFHGPGCRIPTVASPAGPPCFLSPLRAAWMCSGLFTSWDRAWRRGGDTADPTLESRDPKFLSCSVSPAVASWRINLTSLSPGFSVEKMMLTP